MLCLPYSVCLAPPRVWRQPSKEGARGYCHPGPRGPVGDHRYGGTAQCEDTLMRLGSVEIQGWGTLNPDSKGLGMGCV